jgi:putative protein kinase ArgK-like GTPase of G3E family
MSLVEDGWREGETYLVHLYATGEELIVGVTGWPGVGKGTLVNRVARFLLAETAGGHRTVSPMILSPAGTRGDRGG